MRTFLYVATLSTALFLGGTASACINEPRTENEEREFRSRYKRKGSLSNAQSLVNINTAGLFGGLAMVGLGIILAISGYQRAKRKDLQS